MIRPITVLTFLIACGSGLYLYSEKHDVQVLDRKIERTVQQTETLREQSRVLATEWTTLNAPERLRDYADKYLLALKAIQPTQFTSLADLDRRLPAVALPPPPPADNGQLLAATTDADADAITPTVTPTAVASSAVAPSASPDGTPLPPMPPIPPAVPQDAVASAAPPTPAMVRPDTAVKQEAVASAEPPRALTSAGVRPSIAAGIAPGIPLAGSQPPLQAMNKSPDHRTAASAPRVADTRPAAPRPAEVKPAEPRLADARPTEPTWAERQRPVARVPNPPMQAAVQPHYLQPYRAPVSAQPMPVAAPYGGSLLGMARGTPAAPRPTPVNAPNWYNNTN